VFDNKLPPAWHMRILIGLVVAMVAVMGLLFWKIIGFSPSPTDKKNAR
jgi:hypothetical protein